MFGKQERNREVGWLAEIKKNGELVKKIEELEAEHF